MDNTASNQGIESQLDRADKINELGEEEYNIQITKLYETEIESLIPKAEVKERKELPLT